MDYTIALNMTSELVALEILNRVFITLFEVCVTCTTCMHFTIGERTHVCGLMVDTRCASGYSLQCLQAMCLRRGVAGTVGGATPDKRLMGIFIVSSEEVVVDLGNGHVQITPAGNIGFWK